MTIEENDLLQRQIAYINKTLDKVDIILSKNLSVEERRKYLILANQLEEKYRELEEKNLGRSR